VRISGCIRIVVESESVYLREAFLGNPYGKKIIVGGLDFFPYIGNSHPNCLSEGLKPPTRDVVPSNIL
jgi:hypothetical protein